MENHKRLKAKRRLKKWKQAPSQNIDWKKVAVEEEEKYEKNNTMAFNGISKIAPKPDVLHNSMTIIDKYPTKPKPDVSHIYNLQNGYSGFACSGEYRFDTGMLYNQTMKPDQISQALAASANQMLASRNSILTLGKKEAEVLERVSKELIKLYQSQTINIVNDGLSNLSKTVEIFGSSRSFTSKLRKFIQPNAIIVPSVKELQIDQNNVEGVVAGLKDNMVLIQEDIQNLQKIFSALEDYYFKCDGLIGEIDAKILEAQNTLSDSSINEMEKMREEDNLSLLQQKLIDIKEARETSINLAKQARMICKTNVELYTTLDSRLTTRVPILMASVVTNSLSHRGGKTIEHIDKFDQASDSVIRNTNQSIRDNTVKALSQQQTSNERRLELILNTRKEMMETIELTRQKQIELVEARQKFLENFDKQVGIAVKKELTNPTS